MRVLAVTSVGGACGIANYAEMCIEAVRQADRSIEFMPSAEALDPDWLRAGGMTSVINDAEVIWLNYHRGLHSRWTPEKAAEWKWCGAKVVITFHDSYGEAPPDPLAQALHDVADAFIVHEPCAGLPKQILIRQGVPAWRSPMHYDQSHRGWTNGRPILGTVGFNFPWKNFDRLAEVTAEAGWAYLVLSNNATDADHSRWEASNPHTMVLRGFQPTDIIVSHLAGCDATCFAYECANSGTSGAIRLGIAARKPVIAWRDTRQFRDLLEVEKYRTHPCITWCKNFEDLPYVLARVPIQRVDPGIGWVATTDSWTNQGQKYAQVFRSVL